MSIPANPAEIPVGSGLLTPCQLPEQGAVAVAVGVGHAGHAVALYVGVLVGVEDRMLVGIGGVDVLVLVARGA
jgi:hypothetical protein